MTAAITFTDATTRLAEAARNVRDAKEAYDAARETRDQLIVEASDLGMPQRAIAQATELSQPRIVALILTGTGFTESAAS